MKYFITVFVTAVLVAAAAYIYFRGFPIFPSYNKNPISTESAVTVSTPLATFTPSVSPTPGGLTTIKAGGVLVFSAYSIDVPSGWTYIKEAEPTGEVAVDKLILAKAAYKITIFEAATGGAPCLYPGDADSEGPFSRFTSFVDLTTVTGDKLRRGMAQGSTSGYTVCELQSGGYGQPTSFGHVSITTPSGPSKSALDEIDSILASLRKI